MHPIPVCWNEQKPNSQRIIILCCHCSIFNTELRFYLATHSVAISLLFFSSFAPCIGSKTDNVFFFYFWWLFLSLSQGYWFLLCHRVIVVVLLNTFDDFAVVYTFDYLMLLFFFLNSFYFSPSLQVLKYLNRNGCWSV